jgi:hypothetical protein
MAEYKNIVGTGFPPQIQAQIKKREEILNLPTRDNNTLQYLTNKNAWIRLSSGVQVIDKQAEEDDQGIRNLFTRAEINAYYRNKRKVKSERSTLAKNNILQGGTISTNGTNSIIKKGFNETYTQGATDNLGFKPMPGITNVSITTGGKWQTLLQADIEFICYDLDQLDKMSKLYMSLGCTVFLEWGHTSYFKNDNTFEINPQPLTFFNENNKESLRKSVTKKVINTEGNYESITGTVYNFSYSANSDGSYNCKTHIMGAGGLVESLKINNSTNYTFDVYSAKEEESDKFSSILENALYTLQKFISSYGEPDTVATTTQSNSNGKETRLFLKVPFRTPILKNQKTKEKDTYSNLLTRIFQLPNYKGPKFPLDYKASNTNALYGNPWSVLSGHREVGPDLLIPQDFYAGYKTIATAHVDQHKPSAYITLGHLMALVQHLGIFTENIGNQTTPVVYIDYNPETTIIKRGIIEASVDPGKCLVPYSATPEDQTLFFDPFLTLTPDKEVLLWWTTKRSLSHNLLVPQEDQKKLSALDRIENLKNSFKGKLFNVLINIDFAIDSLKNLSNNSEDKNVNLIEYIDTILNGVSISLGKVNALRTFYDDRSNCIRIIDENYQKEEIKTEQILKLENFGTKSTVYDYSYSSKITPKLAAQIVISAQALDSGGIQEFSEDVLSYQKLNGDVIDKFAVNKWPPVPPQLSRNQQDGENKISLQKLFYHFYNVYTLADLKSSTIDNLTTLYADLQNQTYNLINGTPTLLIPLEYQVTLDGISGILPYTIFRLPDNRLPKRYRGKVDFVVFSINHSIENNKWYTTLRGQTLIRN